VVRAPRTPMHRSRPRDKSIQSKAHDKRSKFFTPETGDRNITSDASDDNDAAAAAGLIMMTNTNENRQMNKLFTQPAPLV